MCQVYFALCNCWHTYWHQDVWHNLNISSMLSSRSLALTWKGDMSSNEKMGEDDVTQQPIGALNLSLALWILATCLNGQMRKQISALLLLFGMMSLTCTTSSTVRLSFLLSMPVLPFKKRGWELWREACKHIHAPTTYNENNDQLIPACKHGSCQLWAVGTRLVTNACTNRHK